MEGGGGGGGGGEELNKFNECKMNARRIIDHRRFF